MKLTPLEIPAVILIEPRVFEDARGFFYESYREDLFAQHGIRERFVQDNHSKSGLGVLRGLHYQVAPRAQAKLVRVVRGSIFDVAVDIRRGSGTFGRYVGTVLSAGNRRMLYIPQGFAHGFCVLEDETEVLYKASDIYSPEHERGILWSDPAIGIDWPKMEFSLSDKDKKHPRLNEAVLV